MIHTMSLHRKCLVLQCDDKSLDILDVHQFWGDVNEIGGWNGPLYLLLHQCCSAFIDLCCFPLLWIKKHITHNLLILLLSTVPYVNSQCFYGPLCGPLCGILLQWPICKIYMANTISIFQRMGYSNKNNCEVFMWAECRGSNCGVSEVNIFLVPGNSAKSFQARNEMEV